MTADPDQTAPVENSDAVKPKELPPWLEKIKHFTPAWFAVCMGTGVVVSLLHLFPYQGGYAGRRAFKIMASIFLLLNVISFTTFTVVSILRYVLFRRLWNLMLRHPTQSLFLGCFPMAFATLINGATVVVALGDEDGGGGFGAGGNALVWTLWIFWWIDVALSVLSNFGMIYLMITRQNHSLQTLSAVWLLPIVPTIVASSTGCIVAQALYPISPSLALLTYEVVAVILACGLSMALMIIAAYVIRLITVGFPSAGMTVSVLVPLGPLGQGGYALLLLSEAWPKLLSSPTAAQSQSGSILYEPGVAYGLRSICFTFAVILWVMGFWILIPGLVVLVRKVGRLSFAVPWWGMVFPSGVYALLTVQLSQAIASPFLKVLGSIYAIAVILLWCGIAVRTIKGLFLHGDTRGSPLFHAPCLEEMGAGDKVMIRKALHKLILLNEISDDTVGGGYGDEGCQVRKDLEEALQHDDRQGTSAQIDGSGQSTCFASPDTRAPSS